MSKHEANLILMNIIGLCFCNDNPRTLRIVNPYSKLVSVGFSRFSLTCPSESTPNLPWRLLDLTEKISQRKRYGNSVKPFDARNSVHLTLRMLDSSILYI